MSVMYITKLSAASALSVCFGKVKTYACADQLIAFAGCRYEARPIEERDLPPTARNQAGALQLAGGIGDAWPLDPQHFGEQGLTDWQYVIVNAITHHQQPARQPLLEAVRAVARHRHQDLFEKGLGVGVHETVERRHRLDGAGERRARHPCRGPGDLNEKPYGGGRGAKDGLHRSTTLPADGRRLNDTAVRINRHYRDDPAIGEEYMVERTVGVHQDLRAFAANAFKLRHKLPEVGGWQGQ